MIPVRRARARIAALLLVVLLVGSLVPTAASVDPAAGRCAQTVEARVGSLRAAPYADEPGAGAWRTWSVHVGDVQVPPPPGALSARAVEERAELHRLALARTDAQAAEARAWSDGPASAPWEALALRLVAEHGATDPTLNPPRVSRLLALLETATYDALVLAWDAKYCYQRAPPSAVDPALAPLVPVGSAPSYPSEHAVAAGAASTVLAAFFPGAPLDALAAEAAESRLRAGANYRSDVEAGLALGRAVAERALAARADDGSDRVWDGTGRSAGTCLWSPTPPAFQPAPLEPAWGQVRPWLLGAGSQLRPPPPPACDGAEYRAQVAALHAASLTLTDEQRAIALAWAGGPGTATPPGMALQMALDASRGHGLSTMRHARLTSYVATAVADAGIAAWDAKFHYWGDRPIHGVARHHDPEWRPLLATPPFPGYVSGHATFSGAASEVLAGFFPDDAPTYRAAAEEAALSRFYGGIHIDADNEAGLALGRGIAGVALARAAGDGA